MTPTARKAAHARPAPSPNRLKCRMGNYVPMDPGEANKLTDAMAKLDASYDLSLFVVPPVSLQSLIMSDISTLV
ncbi:hypothetical protein V6N13_117057 [Hibiscus sabdariffa]